jgi:hypothetical protein
MRIIFLLIILTGCINGSQKKDYSFSKSDYDYLNDSLTKVQLPENVNFSDFEKYCRVIPDLKLPFDIKDVDKIRRYTDNMSFCMQNTNFGPQHYLPIAKIIKENYISIIYNIPTSSLAYELYTFDYSGKPVDRAIIYSIDDPLAQIDDKCETHINNNMEIQMNYIIKQHDSLDPQKDIVTKNEQTHFKISKNGKIEKMK